MTKEQAKLTLLKRYFGHDSFRSGQEQLIDSILSGSDVMGIMPTGAGKSVCYQLPALMLGGITLVISPLISLMKDQVNSLIQQGVPTAYLNSSLTPAQFSTALSRARQGAYKLIYVAPERLDAPSFSDFAQHADISMIAVDEAHCVSQWGQDFRPAYLNIKAFADSLPHRPIIAAFTATATNEVKRDIVKMLGLKDPFSITTGFDRQNLYFAVEEPKDKLDETVRLVKSYGGRSGIIYCATRKNTELVCDRLNELGIPCTRYHAGLSDEERRRNQDDFLYDRVKVMAATNAFGMGIDKSNVSFVIHYNMPKNLESYYQEAGRAGRDGSEAVCTLLFSRKDVMTNRFLIDNSNENSELDPVQAELLKKRDYKRLNEMTRYCTCTDCLRHYILDYFGERSGEMCSKCSNCAAGFESEDVTLAAQKILSCVYRMAQRRLKMGEAFVADVLRGSKSKRVAELHCTELSTYGIMSDVSKLKIRAMISGLCDLGYMRRDDYGCLILTVKAKELLFEGKTLSMTFKRSTAETAPKAVTSKSKGGRYSERPELFERLRSVRTGLAEKASVPAYIILPDSSLHDMCRKLPKDTAEFLQISGVGQTKAQRYGEIFTAEIRAYLEEGGEQLPDSDKVTLMRRSDSIPKETSQKKRSSPPATLEELAAELSRKLGCTDDDAYDRLKEFITVCGYVSEDDNSLTVTPKGGINGFALSTKLTPDGLMTVLELKYKAQQLVYDAFNL